MKNQYRFFLQGDSFSKEEKHQIFNVLRLKIGDKITLVKEKKEFLATITKDGYNIIEEITENREANVSLTLAIATLKKDKLEYIFQKATEIGVENFIIFNGENSVKTIDQASFEKTLPRYNKIITEASEQSLRLVCPQIKFTDLKNIDFSNFEKVLITDLEGTPLLQNLNKENKNILLIIGPEGGLSQTEMDFIKAQGGETVSFGKRILRSETAAMVISACVINFYEL